jgi:hypothetical protein
MNNHGYSVAVEDTDVARLLACKDRPWWNATVLRHLHHDLNMSLAEIGNIFGISRQSVHEAAQKVGVQTERKRGTSAQVEEDQTRLSDYERTGLGNFL